MQPSQSEQPSQQLTEPEQMQPSQSEQMQPSQSEQMQPSQSEQMQQYQMQQYQPEETNSVSSSFEEETKSIVLLLIFGAIGTHKKIYGKNLFNILNKFNKENKIIFIDGDKLGGDIDKLKDNRDQYTIDYLNKIINENENENQIIVFSSIVYPFIKENPFTKGNIKTYIFISADHEGIYDPNNFDINLLGSKFEENIEIKNSNLNNIIKNNINVFINMYKDYISNIILYSDANNINIDLISQLET